MVINVKGVSFVNVQVVKIINLKASSL